MLQIVHSSGPQSNLKIRLDRLDSYAPYFKEYLVTRVRTNDHYILPDQQTFQLYSNQGESHGHN
jgi:hypothetical protein